MTALAHALTGGQIPATQAGSRRKSPLSAHNWALNAEWPEQLAAMRINTSGWTDKDACRATRDIHRLVTQEFPESTMLRAAHTDGKRNKRHAHTMFSAVDAKRLKELCAKATNRKIHVQEIEDHDPVRYVQYVYEKATRAYPRMGTQPQSDVLSIDVPLEDCLIPSTAERDCSLDQCKAPATCACSILHQTGARPKTYCTKRHPRTPSASCPEAR